MKLGITLDGSVANRNSIRGLIRGKTLFHLEPVNSTGAIEMDVTHLLTVEVSDRWKVSIRTLERWRYIGIGPKYRRIGGRVVYALEEVERFEQSCDVETYS